VSYAGTTAVLTNPTPKVGEEVTLVCISTPAGSRYATFSHTKKFKESDTQTISLASMLDLKTNVPIVGEGRYSITAKVKGEPEAEHYNLTFRSKSL
jgi:hypothetical protein